MNYKTKTGNPLVLSQEFLRTERNGFVVYKTVAKLNGEEVGELTFLWIPGSCKGVQERFSKWVDRPETGMVKVKESHRRMGIGTTLYKSTSEFLKNEFGLSLYTSDLLTPDGKSLTKKIQK